MRTPECFNVFHSAGRVLWKIHRALAHWSFDSVIFPPHFTSQQPKLSLKTNRNNYYGCQFIVVFLPFLNFYIFLDSGWSEEAIGFTVTCALFNFSFLFFFVCVAFFWLNHNIRPYASTRNRMILLGGYISIFMTVF